MAGTGAGIVIGSHSVKVVQLRMKGGVPRLVRAVQLPFEPGMAEKPFDAAKFAAALDLVRSAGVKPSECMLGLTGRDLIVRYTHVPPVPDWRLDMLMKFEIEEVSEQSGGEVSADWSRLDLDASATGENTILVALAKNSALLPRMEVVKKAGFRVRGACPNAVGLHQAFVTTAKLPPGEVTLLMHVGAENTDVAIQKDGKLLFARNVSGGGRLFTDAIVQQFNVKYDRAEKMKHQKADVTPRSSARYEDSMAEKVSNAALGVTGQFVSMVHSSVMFCKAQTKMKDLSVDRVILAGGGANLKGFAEYLSQNLGIPVETFDPMKAVDASALPEAEQRLVADSGTSLAAVLGLSLLAANRGGAFTLEILPEEYRKRRNFVERESWMIGAGAAVAVLIAILFFTSSRDHGTARAEERDLLMTQNRIAGERSRFTRAEERYRELQLKHEVLRDLGRVGPAVRRAAAMVDEILVGGRYDALYVARMTSGSERVPPLKPAKSEEDAEPSVPRSPGDDGPMEQLVRVSFVIQIQPSGVNPNMLYSNFIDALNQRAAELPGVRIDPGQAGRSNFSFSIEFRPAPEAPPAEEE